MKQPSLSPSPSPSLSRYWHPVYTKPRNEKKVADRLSLRGFEVYCPLREDRVRWSDRWKTIQKPVFTSYVFVHITEAERLEVLNDPGVVRSVFYLKKPGVVREEEIKAIRLFLEEFHEVEMEQFKPMQRVVVKEGPLVGEAGNIVSTSGGYARLRLESMGINLIAKVHIHKLSEIKST